MPICSKSLRTAIWAMLVTFSPLAYQLAANELHPIVLGFERFHAKENAGTLAGGLLLLGELNCTSCHKSDAAEISVKSAPVLGEVGSRIRPEFLRRYLENPSATKPGTTMPHVLHAVSEVQRKEQVDALVHFLASTGEIEEAAPIASAARRGEQLFHRVGCVACHLPRRESRPQVSEVAVPLPDLSAKYSIPGLTRFLQNPLAVRPSGRMPDFNLKEQEARDIACYLLQDLNIPAAMSFAYYEGDWDRMPNFSELEPKQEGAASSFDVSLDRENQYAIRFEGPFRAERDGTYQFFLTSDDGSKLYVDDRLVVSHDGVHASTEKSASVELKAGKYQVVVEYFEQWGDQELRVEFQGPGSRRKPLESAMVIPSTSSAQRFAVNPALASKGREIFLSAGCAACHAVPGKETPRPISQAARLSELDPAAGCLGDRPPANAPRYALSEAQRASLREALQNIAGQSLPTLTIEDRITRTMTSLNCFACHVRNSVGGVEADRNSYFQTAQPEMGDEGRIPPDLSGVGAKLQANWFMRIFEKGAKDRPYMFTRMPRFGLENVQDLATLFKECDRSAGLPDEPQPTFDRKIKSVGRQLVGDKGLSCIKCHTWGDSKATGIQAISLTSMTRRLNPEWFERYLFDPQKYRPGTRMPAAWPNGQSPFANILDGDARMQIYSIWAYLEDAESANPPMGLISNPIELVATSQPLIYRNFLQGAGSRAIGVGYPEHANLAFDAEHCRLAMLWQGAFVDASMHWVGRGSGFQRPLGDNVLQFPEGAPVAVINSLDESWPDPKRENETQFQGYRLDSKGRPKFAYSWKGLQITDHFEPEGVSKQIEMRRIVHIHGSPVSNAHFRLTTADQIQDEGNRRYKVDNDWIVSVESEGEPVIRHVGGKHELIVPIVFSANSPSQTSIIQRFVW